ncbi:MBL fold metallo-hydrolase [Streptomyces olivochromogenes]|uniref:MBL fold metallo-hydrolase n=1 Tax=Streptomyces olivochromogenes TaxID=1963 RepID=UPI001F2A9964|nr:MBL fold metallo-hydrolase [Streptomyces olivochromogenes]MCF3130623.1 MBL fold metallo-hydrolase [Streptomyces olivochromogenes]
MLGTITTTKTDAVTVHTYTAPESGWRASSHLIELPGQLVLVDTPLLPALTGELLAYAADLGKPIARLYVSHAHPDHYAGISLINAPAYALAPVRQTVNEFGAAHLQGAYLMTGHPDIETSSPHIGFAVEAGEEIIDGVRFSFEPVSHAEAGDQLTIGLPDDAILIAQDVVFNGVHAFLGEKKFDAWIEALDALEARPYEVVLPGHGLPGDRGLYAATRAYLTVARDAVGAADGPADLNRRLISAYPNHTGTAMQPVQNYFLFA